MKHSVCFKALLLLSSCLLLLVSCTKRDEIDFTGVVIDTRQCTASYLKPNLGYLVELSKPSDAGDDYTTDDGVVHHNVVILYEPDRVIYKDDHLSGSFYFDDEYSDANCEIHWKDLKVPMGVFVSVSVD